MSFIRTFSLAFGMLLAEAANAQSGFFPNSVVPNPVTVGQLAQFHFEAFVDSCNYDYAMRAFGVAGNALTLTYDIFPKVPPDPICFTIPPPIGVRVNLMPLPPGDYVIRAQGYFMNAPLQPIVANFRVLGGSTVAVPLDSLPGNVVFGLAVVLLGLSASRKRVRG